MINITKKDFSIYGQCVAVDNGLIELVATLDVGPRIVRFGFLKDNNNFMFCDTENMCTQELDSPFEGKTWKILGGHRLWTSPEANPRSYAIEEKPVKCDITQNGVILTPPPQEYTNLQMQIEIVMNEGNSVEVIHRITNNNAWDIEFAPWALTVMAPGGVEVFPMPSHQTGFLANRVMAIWPYTKMNDKRFYMGEKFIALKQDVNADCPFKIGLNLLDGYSVYFLNNQAFKKTFSPIADGTYPDYGVCFETYTNAHMIEIETLGEYKKTAPNETVTHTETWHLYDGVTVPDWQDEKSIEEKLNMS